jgi:hypothetical protein
LFKLMKGFRFHCYVRLLLLLLLLNSLLQLLLDCLVSGFAPGPGGPQERHSMALPLHKL